MNELLQEAKEVLFGLSDDGCFGACWLSWGKERGDENYHSEACQRAVILYSRLLEVDDGTTS